MTADETTISQCVYCGTLLTAETLTRDHVIPKIRGGYKGDRNIAPACRSCNEAKGPLTASEYFAVRDDPEDLAALIRLINHEIAQATVAVQTEQRQQTETLRQLAQDARKMQREGKCIRPLGFTVCTCDICHPERRLKAEAAERFHLSQQPFKDLQP